MSRALGVLLLMVLGGCSHAARRVDCDQHLQPINPPNPVVKPSPAPKSP